MAIASHLLCLLMMNTDLRFYRRKESLKTKTKTKHRLGMLNSLMTWLQFASEIVKCFTFCVCERINRNFKSYKKRIFYRKISEWHQYHYVNTLMILYIKIHYYHHFPNANLQILYFNKKIDTRLIWYSLRGLTIFYFQHDF